MIDRGEQNLINTVTGKKQKNKSLQKSFDGQKNGKLESTKTKRRQNYD